MSIESARAFLERAKNDEEFRNKLNAAEDRDSRVAMVKAEGFDFTQEDWAAVSDELSDEDLDQAAGGVCNDFGCGVRFTWGE